MIARANFNRASTDQRDVKTTSGGFRSLMWDVSIKADTTIVAALADQFLDNDVCLVSKSRAHQGVRFCLMQEELQKPVVSWKTGLT